MKKILLWAALAVFFVAPALAGIEDYSTTAGSNTALFPEGMDPSAVNDGMRQVQADVRVWYQDPSWRDLGNTPVYVDANTFTISGNVTASYVVDQRIKLSGSGAMGTVYGVITASSFGSPNTTIDVTLDSGSLDATLNTAYAGVNPTNDPISFAAITVPPAFVTSTYLATDAVTTAKVVNGAITSVKLAIDSVTTDKIVAASITSAKLATSSVVNAAIIDGTITSTKLAAPFTYQVDTVQATTSGTSKTFNIPSGARIVSVGFMGVSSNSTSNYHIQLNGESSGYNGVTSTGAGTAAWTSGILATQQVSAAGVYSGTITLTRMDSSTNTWTVSGSVSGPQSGGGALTHFSAGDKSLSAALSSMAVTTVSGDTLDAGKLNVSVFY